MKTKKIGNVRIEGNTVRVSYKYLDECVDFINKNNIHHIEICDLYYKHDDINFLNRCNNIEHLTVNHNYIPDLSVIYSLKSLKKLDLTENDANPNLDFYKIQSLETLFCHWSNKFKGLEQLTNLKELAIWKYAPKSKDLEKLTALKNLEVLILTQARVTSLKGIGHLTKLQELELNYSRSLSDISELVSIKNNIKRLEIESCKKIADYQPVEKLSSLEQLALNSSSDLKTISFIKELKNLKEFVFWNTNVLDGDLSPLKNIEEVHFNDKKHYSHKLSDFK